MMKSDRETIMKNVSLETYKRLTYLLQNIIKTTG